MNAVAPLTIELEWLEHGAGLDVPSYETLQSAGMDLRAACPEEKPMTLQPGQRALVPCGFRMALPAGFEAQVRPRSGLALKHGLMVVNAPGTIDADYRGEVMVLLGLLGDKPFTIERGMRIAQMVIAPVTQGQWSVVKELEATARGAGGFGSTGT